MVVLLAADATLGETGIWAEQISASRALQLQGRLDQAAYSYRKALDLAGSPTEKAHTHLALAHLGMESGDYAGSEMFFQAALAILDARGIHELESARARSRLGLLYALMGRHTVAESTTRRAVSVLERLGAPGEVMAEGYLSLAEVHFKAGRLGQAERYYERSLRIFEEQQGDTRPAMTQVLLAGVYLMRGRYVQAEQLLRQATASLRSAAGDQSLEAGFAMARLGLAISGQRRYADAIQLQLSALEILERTLGRDHITVARTMHNLARTYMAVRRTDDAEPLYRRALDVLGGKLGPTHPDVTMCMLHYADMLATRGRKREAKHLRNEARRRMAGQEDPSRFVIDIRELLQNATRSK